MVLTLAIFKTLFSAKICEFLHQNHNASFIRKNEEIDKRKQQKDLKEIEWEMTKKQGQHQTRNRHEGGELHM